MKTRLTRPRRFEFGFPSLDATVLVEDYGDSVEIRSTRDTFSERRKTAFIRELAAEGFIDESYHWFSGTGPEAYLGVHWHVDFSWLELPAAVITGARRFMLRLLLGGLVLWGIEIACVACGPGR